VPSEPRNAKGSHDELDWYKLHLDVADGDIPISWLLTSAPLHDSQAAIPAYNGDSRARDQPR
jgi:hypothetical protein